MYKITIEKIEITKQTVRGEYGVIDKRPYTKEEVENSHDADQLKGKIKEVWGIKHNVEKTVKTEQMILEQTVDDLDLIAIVKAINNIDS